MNEVKVFENVEFGKVRIVEKNDTPWFVGKDVAEILGYSNPQKAIRDHVDEEDKGVNEIGTPGGIQKMPVINESGLYSLILSSKLPAAKRFKRWVTGEVLPAIRKTGGYLGGTEGMTDSEIMARALMVAQKTMDNQRRQLEIQRPKALFADSVSASKSTILVGELAKILKQNGVDIGAKRLFQWMRENGYLINRNGTDRNMPTQRAMNLGLFTIKETVINHSDGTTSISKTVKVTGKGQIYFINKFLAEREAIAQ